jgi:hypothetical protein
VQDPTCGTKWSHAVCPGDARKLPKRTGNESAAREFQIKFGDNGEVIAREATV